MSLSLCTDKPAKGKNVALSVSFGLDVLVVERMDINGVLNMEKLIVTIAYIISNWIGINLEVRITTAKPQQGGILVDLCEVNIFKW